MMNRIRRRILPFVIWLCILGILTLAVFLGLSLLPSQTLIAAVTKIEDPSGHLIYRSQHSLPDASGKAWQVVLFKEINAAQQCEQLYLRLVGLPGAAEVAHPKALEITSAPGKLGKLLTAPDAFPEEAPAPTVGQYNMQAAIAHLPNGELQLTIPLVGAQTVTLQVPGHVAQEWQIVASQSF